MSSGEFWRHGKCPNVESRTAKSIHEKEAQVQIKCYSEKRKQFTVKNTLKGTLLLKNPNLTFRLGWVDRPPHHFAPPLEQGHSFSQPCTLIRNQVGLP